jgi:hypothetical protein
LRSKVRLSIEKALMIDVGSVTLCWSWGEKCWLIDLESVTLCWSWGEKCWLIDLESVTLMCWKRGKSHFSGAAPTINEEKVMCEVMFDVVVRCLKDAFCHFFDPLWRGKGWSWGEKCCLIDVGSVTLMCWKRGKSHFFVLKVSLFRCGTNN